MHVSSVHLRGETMTYCVPSACKLSFMPQFKIVEVRECDPVLWLATWAAEYGGSAGFDEDEYAQLIDLARQNSTPVGYFERVGRWKDSANTNGRWKPNVASVAYVIWLQAEAEQPCCPADEQAVSFLDGWSSRTYEDIFSAKRVNKRFGLSRATTLLHFISGGRFPIYDSNVIEASVVTAKPAIRGHFKTGHRDWPKT